jgi:YVTN family beta-propeller protein
LASGPPRPNVLFQTYIAGQRLTALLDRHLETARVTSNPFGLLSALGIWGPITPTELASRIGMPPTDTAVWTASGPTNTVVRLDPATNRVTAEVPVGTFPVDGVIGPDGLVWIPNQGDNSVSRIDPATNRVVDTGKVGPLPFVARRGFGDMWISNFGGFAVWRLRAG